MRRREFLFTSLKASLLLGPVLSIRRAEAQQAPPKRVFFWVNCVGYPSREAFFPTGTETSFQLGPMLSSLEPLKSDMILLGGIDISPTGYDTGSNHVRTIGKVLTAHDIMPHPSDSEDGLHGGISIDQLIAQELGLTSLELQVTDIPRPHLRNCPFSIGPGQSKLPIVYAEQAWDRAFGGAALPSGSELERLQRLRMRKSLLDDLTLELKRFRRELSGVEKIKLDIHEDAIRKSERSVRNDLSSSAPPCEAPERIDPGSFLPARTEAHFDLMFAALACDRVQVGSIMQAFSGYHWRYEWVSGVSIPNSVHDEVHHRADRQHDAYVATGAWDWNQLSAFVQRLKSTPEGNGTLLDNTIVLAISHFGDHHYGHHIPAILFGNAQGQLRTGRYLELPESVENDRLLTSVAHLMGLPIAGIGNDPNCGPLTALL